MNVLWARVMQSTSAEYISELDILEQSLWLIAGVPQHDPSYTNKSASHEGIVLLLKTAICTLLSVCSAQK